MAQCDHPASGEAATAQVGGRHTGEYIVRMGSEVAQGPIPMDKIAGAGQLSRENTGMVALAYRLRDQRCDECGGWWSEIMVRPARPGDDVGDDLLSG
jgi:hypothetical protein